MSQFDRPDLQGSASGNSGVFPERGARLYGQSWTAEAVSDSSAVAGKGVLLLRKFSPQSDARGAGALHENHGGKCAEGNDAPGRPVISIMFRGK